MSEPDGPIRLPRRDEVLADMDRLVEGGSRLSVIVVEVAAFDGLSRIDSGDAAAAVAETARRLNRLIRSRDVLGFEPPARFLLGCVSLAPEQAGALVERIRGGVAMPVDVGGEPMSLVVDIGTAFWSDNPTAGDLVAAAEVDLERIRPGG